MPAELEALEASVTAVLSKLAALPLPALVDDLRRTVQSVEGLVSSPDTKQAVAALSQAAVRLEALIGTPISASGRCWSRRGRRSLRRMAWSGRTRRCGRHERSAQGADWRGPFDPRVRRLPGTPSRCADPRQDRCAMTTSPLTRLVTLGALAAGLALAGCADGQPTRFYTLSPLEASPCGASPTTMPDLTVGVGPVTLPTYLDRPQLVTRAGGNRMVLADFDSWVEPLPGMFARGRREPGASPGHRRRRDAAPAPRFCPRPPDRGGRHALRRRRQRQCRPDARWWVFGRRREAPA